MECLEALYGGAAGGGKSAALLMAALQFVEVPNYSALILRRTFADLKLPGALLDRSQEWLAGTGAKYNSQEHRWRFPSGASLQFGYADNESDVYRYQGAEFAFIGLDEATQFTEFQMRYLFSRLRRRVGIPVPLRYRLASNPGNVGHEFVKRRFIEEPEGRVFVPARLRDNPHINREEYAASLAQLDPVTRAQLEDGDWDAVQSDLFPLAMLQRYTDRVPEAVKGRVRAWDKGYSALGDYTVGVRMSRTEEGLFIVEDMVRARVDPDKRNRLIKATAEADDDAFGKRVQVIVEQPPGAGAETTKRLVRELAGHVAHAVRPVGKKEERAEPWAQQVLAGNARLLRAAWNRDFVSEHVLFPNGANDDIVDAASSAFLALTGRYKLNIMC